MLIALILCVIAAAIGWRRAARQGGTTSDKLQYAAAHGIPAFLVGMIAMTVAVHLGLI